MRSVASKMTLTALLLGVAVTAAHAGEPSWVWPEDRPQPPMLAEDGSYRSLDNQYQLREKAARRHSEMDSSENMVRMIKEQPTAAGSDTERRTADEFQERTRTMYKPPIQRDRELYGH